MEYESTKAITFLQNWITRGLFYMFVSLISFDDGSFPSWGIIMNLAAILILSMGCLYIVMVKY
jgi:hypothetical protein